MYISLHTIEILYHVWVPSTRSQMDGAEVQVFLITGLSELSIQVDLVLSDEQFEPGQIIINDAIVEAKSPTMSKPPVISWSDAGHVASVMSTRTGSVEVRDLLNPIEGDPTRSHSEGYHKSPCPTLIPQHLENRHTGLIDKVLLTHWHMEKIEHILQTKSWCVIS